MLVGSFLRFGKEGDVEMDVIRIQKINDMALELLKQGLAQDREAAVAQAERIFEGKSADDYQEMRQTVKEVKEEKREILEGRDGNRGSDLSDNKIKEILKKNTDFLVRTIKEFNAKISSLETQMADLKSTISGIQGPRIKELVTDEVPPVIDREDVKPDSNPQETSQREEVPAPQEPKRHPRSGNYVENDVSIEKFFYMGSK